MPTTRTTLLVRRLLTHALLPRAAEPARPGVS